MPSSPQSRRVACPIHVAEHEYAEDEVEKLLLFMQVEDWEDGPRCLRELLDEGLADSDPFSGYCASQWRRMPPDGWKPTIPSRYWHRGDTIPAGVYVQALDGTVHQAAEAWENTDFEWLVEIVEIGSAR